MTWTLDPSHSSIEFAVKHMVISTTRGRFTKFNVEADVDESDLAASQATVTIDTGSIDSQDARRDAHLRSGDFFDSTKYPEMKFVTKRFEPRGGSDYHIVGDLTIRDVTKEVALDGEVSGPVKDPWGNVRVGLSASGKVNRKEWGLTWNSALETGGVLVGDDVKLTIETELLRPAA
jgi:polyisoprenoid-binding protein YceI